MRSVVVLPAPFGPKKPKTSPRSAAKDTSRHAGRPPKDLESPCASIAAKRRRSYPSALPGVLPGSRRCASSSPPDSAEPGVLPAASVTMAGLRAPRGRLRAPGVGVTLLRRDPHYFLPTAGKRYLLFGSNANAMREQFLSFFSERDWRANEALQRELSAIRDAVAPTWLEEPLSIEDTAAKYVRPALRQIFVDLCRKPVGQYL